VARIGLVLLLAGLFIAGAYAGHVWWENRSVDRAARLLDRGQYAKAAHSLFRTPVLAPDAPAQGSGAQHKSGG
jgi:hypothetical protein